MQRRHLDLRREDLGAWGAASCSTLDGAPPLVSSPARSTVCQARSTHRGLEATWCAHEREGRIYSRQHSKVRAARVGAPACNGLIDPVPIARVHAGSPIVPHQSRWQQLARLSASQHSCIPHSRDSHKRQPAVVKDLSHT